MSWLSLASDGGAVVDLSWIVPADFSGAPVLYIGVALLALLLTGVAKGGFAGVGALATPLLMLVIPPKLALGMWLPLLVWCDILTIRTYPRQWQLRPILMISPGVLAGIVFGWRMLGRLDPGTLKIWVGGLSIVFVLAEWGRIWLVGRFEKLKRDETWRPNYLTAAPFGAAAGFGTIIAHAAGPFTTMYFLLQRLDQRTFVGTAARFYFVFNTIKIPFLIQAGSVTRESFALGLWLMPLAPLTVWAGAAMNRRVSPVAFRQIVQVLLVVTGAYLVGANL